MQWIHLSALTGRMRLFFRTQAVENNIEHLKEAKEELESGNITEALHAIYLIDNNQYAFLLTQMYMHILRNMFSSSLQTGLNGEPAE